MREENERASRDATKKAERIRCDIQAAIAVRVQVRVRVRIYATCPDLTAEERLSYAYSQRRACTGTQAKEERVLAQQDREEAKQRLGPFDHPKVRPISI